jgi:hypothetical protein
MNSPRRLLLCLLLVAAVLMPVGVTLAQRDLPGTITSAPMLSPDQRQQVEQWVRDTAPGLGDESPAVRKRSRDAVMRQLANPSVSAAFRLAYSKLLMPVITPLADDERTVVAVNAMLVAGELATTASAELLQKHRADKRIEVRFAAVAGTERLFRAIEAKAPTIDPREAELLVTQLGRGVREETNAYVLDVYVRALMAASAVNGGGSRSDFATLRSRALSELSRSITDRIQKQATVGNDSASLSAFLRAGRALRDAMTQGARLPDETVRDAVVYAGNVASFLLTRFEAGDYPLPDPAGGEDARQEALRARASAVQLLTMVEAIIHFGSVNLDPDRAPPRMTMAEEFGKATAVGDKAFRLAVTTVIDRDGILAGEPFRIRPDRIRQPGG